MPLPEPLSNWTAHAAKPVRRFSSLDPKKLVLASAGGIAIGYAVVLVGMLVQRRWIGDGHPIVTDFLALFTTGRMALSGKAVAAYDPKTLHHAMEALVVGHPFHGGLVWSYPPHFLFVVSVLALLPYAVAFAAWSFGTLALYVAAAGAAAQDRAATLLALAPPFVFGGLLVGQNGFFTAALFAAFLLLLIERRPALAGIAIGLLTYKPQFGILVPLALIAGGQWRAIVSAAVTTAVLFLAAGAVFGFATVPAFLHALPAITQSLLTQGHVGWGKIQSVYGVVRWMGGSDAIAWVLQVFMTTACAAFVVWLWCQKAQPCALKAAALCSLALLATPYVFVYDFPSLTIAVAFLYRSRPFDQLEKAALALALVPLAIYAGWTAPIGLVTLLMVAGLVLRRSMLEMGIAFPGLYRHGESINGHRTGEEG